MSKSRKKIAAKEEKTSEVQMLCGLISQWQKCFLPVEPSNIDTLIKGIDDLIEICSESNGYFKIACYVFRGLANIKQKRYDEARKDLIYGMLLDTKGTFPFNGSLILEDVENNPPIMRDISAESRQDAYKLLAELERVSSSQFGTGSSISSQYYYEQGLKEAALGHSEQAFNYYTMAIWLNLNTKETSNDDTIKDCYKRRFPLAKLYGRGFKLPYQKPLVFFSDHEKRVWEDSKRTFYGITPEKPSTPPMPVPKQPKKKKIKTLNKSTAQIQQALKTKQHSTDNKEIEKQQKLERAKQKTQLHLEIKAKNEAEEKEKVELRAVFAKQAEAKIIEAQEQHNNKLQRRKHKRQALHAKKLVSRTSAAEPTLPPAEPTINKPVEKKDEESTHIVSNNFVLNTDYDKKQDDIYLSLPQLEKSYLELLTEEKDTKAFIVGGWVRDYLLKTPKKTDLDIVTNASDETIRKVFKDKATITNDGNYYKIIFKDGKSIDVWRYENTNKKSRKKDALNRDFTINALYVDKNGKIHDPLKRGLKDIGLQPDGLCTNPRLVMIKLPEISFKEDPIRILRAIRLSNNLEIELEVDITIAIEKCASLLHEAMQKNSGKVNSHLIKMFRSNPVKSFSMLNKFGLMNILFPELATYIVNDPWVIAEITQLEKIQRISLNYIFGIFITSALMQGKLDIDSLVKNNPLLFRNFQIKKLDNDVSEQKPEKFLVPDYILQKLKMSWDKFQPIKFVSANPFLMYSPVAASPASSEPIFNSTQPIHKHK